MLLANDISRVDFHPECAPQVTTRKKLFTTSHVSRYRWNVLDLLSIFGKSAITCHLFCDVDMSAVESHRESVNRSGEHLTVSAYFLKAISLAQKTHPVSRTLYLPSGTLVTYNDVVAGFTVERVIDGQPAVFFGEIDNPCDKSLLDIAHELKAYSEAPPENVGKIEEQIRFARKPWLFRQIVLMLAAWSPTLRIACMKATFGMSSLGALGVRIAAGPSVCTSVFGIGAVEDRAVVREGQVVSRPMTTIALCYDQRVMDGSEGARFLVHIRDLLEKGIPELAGDTR